MAIGKHVGTRYITVRPRNGALLVTETEDNRERFYKEKQTNAHLQLDTLAATTFLTDLQSTARVQGFQIEFKHFHAVRDTLLAPIGSNLLSKLQPSSIRPNRGQRNQRHEGTEIHIQS